MPNLLKLIFDNPINVSLQVGDAVYLSSYDTDYNVIQSSEYLAPVLEIGAGYIIIDKDPASQPIITASSNEFISFAKNININESSLKGYYTDVTFENYSNKRAELFAISSEVVPSSK